MSEPKTTTGFELYESLRYFLPGVLLVFLFTYLAFPECGASYTLAEKLAAGVLVGFVAHSFGMYKWVPGTSPLRTEFRAKTEQLLSGVDDPYVRWDAAFLAMTGDARQQCRKYFALGAFKLDMAFVMIVFLAYYVFGCLSSIVATGILTARSFVAVAVLLIVIYVVRDDGLCDLRRAFNIALICLLERKKSGDLERVIKLIEENKDSFVAGERKLVDPPYVRRDRLLQVLGSIRSRIRSAWRKE